VYFLSGFLSNQVESFFPGFSWPAGQEILPLPPQAGKLFILGFMACFFFLFGAQDVPLFSLAVEFGLVGHRPNCFPFLVQHVLFFSPSGQ